MSKTSKRTEMNDSIRFSMENSARDLMSMSLGSRRLELEVLELLNNIQKEALQKIRETSPLADATSDLEEKGKVRRAALSSGVIICNGKEEIKTEYGTKTATGVANIFLHQLEKVYGLRSGTFQV